MAEYAEHKYISLVERRISTLKGVTLIFQPGVPTLVPAKIEEDVIAAGLVREDHLQAFTKAEPEVAEDPFDRETFEAAVLEVVARNNADDLTSNGNPKTKAVEAITGFKVSAINVVNFLKKAG